MIPVYGWMPLWSEDKKLLVQVFTDLETGLMKRVTVHFRTTDGSWGLPIEVKEDC